MKHFPKPLGHCLTTAVMTSSMLKVYSLPAVEAATLDTSANPQPATGDAIAPPEESAPLPSEIPAAQTVAQPEVMTPLESTPAPSPAAEAVPAPVASPTVSAPLPDPSEKPPAEAAVVKPESGLAPAPQKPEAIEAHPAAEAIPSDPKAAPANSKGTAASAQTVAGMRQIIEKKLATIVERDKAEREALWQQNLINTALQYAWKGEFVKARQIAMHPALPVDAQTELLQKITAIETQPEIAQANLTNPLNRQPSSGQGRVVPSNYPTVNVPSITGDYSGVMWGNQCPAIAPPATVAKPPAPKATPAAAKTGMPSFIPALGQNLAARLAQLSQTPASPPVGKTAAAKPPISSQLFAGVAARSVHLPLAQITKSQPNKSQPQKLVALQPAQPQLRLTASSSDVPPPAPVLPAPTAAIAPVQPDPVEPAADRGLDQMVESTLSHSLGQIGIPFSHWLAQPLSFAWDWWSLDDPSAGLGESMPLASAEMTQLPAFSIAANTGLDNSWLQTVEQKLVAFPSPRSALKYSLPNSAGQSTKGAAKAVARSSADAANLLATRCAMAPGSSNLGSYTIDPATSKKLGWVNLMFPLPIPSVITSAFGWRIHPISGSLSFHSGLDIGAPMGTPVLAAISGRVVAADYMGGYGLAVVVENQSKHQRNLYGHLSGIAVQPGMQIAQGSVLGWVGSTGNSTGPHLHFESQIYGDNGWTAVDPIASAAVSVAQGR